jgi:3'-phosphoadenosine 5'-phosphosulfate sulfotransferase (PAPS reductase)/FAD synthetase
VLIHGEKSYVLTKSCPNAGNNYYKESSSQFLHTYMSSQNPTTASMHIEKLADEFDSKTAQEVLKWALDTFGTKIALASSFGAEDVVIIDMMANLDKNRARVFTLDTGCN